MAEKLKLKTPGDTAAEIYEVVMNKPREEALRVIHVALAVVEGSAWMNGWESGVAERLSLK